MVPSNTILRIVVGCVGSDCEVVRLDAVRLGARWVTDEDDIRRFVQRLTPKADSTPALRTQAARGRGSQRLDRELDHRGL